MPIIPVSPHAPPHRRRYTRVPFRLLLVHRRRRLYGEQTPVMQSARWLICTISGHRARSHENGDMGTSSTDGLHSLCIMQGGFSTRWDQQATG